MIKSIEKYIFKNNDYLFSIQNRYRKFNVFKFKEYKELFCLAIIASIYLFRSRKKFKPGDVVCVNKAFGEHFLDLILVPKDLRNDIGIFLRYKEDEQHSLFCEVFFEKSQKYELAYPEHLTKV